MRFLKIMMIMLLPVWLDPTQAINPSYKGGWLEILRQHHKQQKALQEMMQGSQQTQTYMSQQLKDSSESPESVVGALESPEKVEIVNDLKHLPGYGSGDVDVATALDHDEMRVAEDNAHSQLITIDPYYWADPRHEDERYGSLVPKEDLYTVDRSGHLAYGPGKIPEPEYPEELEAMRVMQAPKEQPQYTQTMPTFQLPPQPPPPAWKQPGYRKVICACDWMRQLGPGADRCSCSKISDNRVQVDVLKMKRNYQSSSAPRKKVHPCHFVRVMLDHPGQILSEEMLPPFQNLPQHHQQAQHQQQLQPLPQQQQDLNMYPLAYKDH